MTPRTRHRCFAYRLGLAVRGLHARCSEVPPVHPQRLMSCWKNPHRRSTQEALGQLGRRQVRPAALRMQRKSGVACQRANWQAPPRRASALHDLKVTKVEGQRVAAVPSSLVAGLVASRARRDPTRIRSWELTSVAAAAPHGSRKLQPAATEVGRACSHHAGSQKRSHSKSR